MRSRTLGIVNCLVIAAALVAGISLVQPAAAQNQRTRNQAKTLEDQGAAAFRRREYRAAADKYSEAIKLIPNNPSAHYWKGYALYYVWMGGREELAGLEKTLAGTGAAPARADLEKQIADKRVSNQAVVTEALNELTTAISQGFRPIEVYRVRVFINYELKNYDAALDDVNKGLAIAPKDLEFLKGLAEIHLARDEASQALNALERARQVAPNDPDIQYNLARVYFANGNVRGQQEAAETALARGTRFPGETHYLLADAYRKLGNADEAIKSYLRAISSKPDMYRAYRNLADVYRNEARFEDAIGILKKAMAVFPVDGEIYTDLSWYYSLADRPRDAVEAAKAGITLLRDNYVPFTNLCRAYNELQEYAMAVSACNNALRFAPNDGETHYYLGNALVGQRKPVEATRMYTRAVAGLLDYTSRNPGYSDGWYLLGNAYFADKQYDKAEEAYLKALQISPKFLKARVNLGITYTFRKNKAAALEQYNLLLPLNKALADRLKAEIDRM